MKNRKETSNKLTEEEKKQRNELNEYIRNEILHYGSDKALPRFLWNRINAMRVGKFMHKGSFTNMHQYYSYQDILYVFRYSKNEISKYFSNKTFNNEQHKINGMLLIVEKNLNTVKDALNRREKMLEKVKDEDTSYISDDVKIAEYKTKSTTKNKNFDKFW